MQHFSFNDDKILEALKKAKIKGTEFMGSATSDFQSHPHLNYTTIEAKPKSDWEMQVHRVMQNKKHKILAPQNISEFPQFFKNREYYIKRCRDLGENMFRLSFDFGRLCPEPYVFDKELMEEYISILALIRENGLEPMLTLYHWPSPTHLLEIDKDDNIITGAWEHKDIINQFQFYVKNVVQHLEDKNFVRNALQKYNFSKETQEKLIIEGFVRYFVSVNEPINLLLPTYILGLFPPFKKFRFGLAKQVMEKVVEAHDIVIHEIRNSKLPTDRGALKIGAAHNWTFFDGLLGKFAHSLVNAKLARKFENSQKETDFVGLHYYFRMKLGSRGKKIYGDNPYFGDVHPAGIHKVLKEMNKEYPNKDIFITEFGFSDNEGLRRPYWILETVRHVLHALEEDIPVKGMLLWTLVNNFEWNLGVHQKFGLFDERELKEPLIPSSGNSIKSWEAWSAAVKAVTHPSTENLAVLQEEYVKAVNQFNQTTSKK